MRILVLLSLLLLALRAFANDPVEVGSGKADGKQFTFVLTSVEIHKTPQWHSGSVSRAVTPRQAIYAARKQLKSFVGDGDKWPFDDISLFDLGEDRWIFQVRFHRDYGPTTAVTAGEYFNIPVLMNGAVVKPTIIYDERLKMRNF